MSEDEKLKIPQIDLADSPGETSVMPTAAPSVPAIDVMTTELTEEELDEQLAFEQLERHRKQRRRKKRIRIGIAAGLGIAAAAAWFLTHPPVPEEGDAWQPVTAYAYQGDFVTDVSSNGATQPLKLTVVTPEVDGIIQDVRIVEGQQVAEGDVLFTIKNDDLDRAVAEAARGVSSAQSGVNSAYTQRADAASVRSEAWDEYDRKYDQYEQAYKQYEQDLKKYPELVKEYEQKLKEYQEQLAQYNSAFWAWYVARNNSQNKVPEGDPNTMTEEELIKYNEECEKYEASLEYERKQYETVAGGRPIPPEKPAEPTPPTPPDPPADAELLSAVHGADDSINSAAQGLEGAQESLSQAQENADKRTVKAPATGTVIAMNAVEGASTAGGQGTGALVQIADLSQMKVTVEVNEIDIRNIEVGQRATATFAALPGVELEAVVERIASTASGSVGGEGYGGGGGVVTYAVDLLIPKPDKELKPGMTATVVIRTQYVPDTVIVPVAALVDNGDGTYAVEVVTDEETWESELRPVEVIAQNTSEAAIKGDVADGDQVLMGGPGYDDMGGDDMAYAG